MSGDALLDSISTPVSELSYGKNSGGPMAGSPSSAVALHTPLHDSHDASTVSHQRHQWRTSQVLYAEQ